MMPSSLRLMRLAVAVRRRVRAHAPLADKLAKATTYGRYLREYLKHGDLRSVLDSVLYTLSKRSVGGERLTHTDLGTFYCRAGTNDFMYAALAYEWNVKRAVERFAKSCDVYLDVGACIGDYSIMLARRGLRCYAFEPSADNVRALTINVLLNDLGDLITPFPFGLGARDEVVQFAGDPVNTGSSHVARDGAGGTLIELKRLDSIRDRLEIGQRSAVLMKIDAEGMELEALAGARDFLRALNRCVIILESAIVGRARLVEALAGIDSFTVTPIDELNLAAVKGLD